MIFVVIQVSIFFFAAAERLEVALFVVDVLPVFVLPVELLPVDVVLVLAQA